MTTEFLRFVRALRARRYELVIDLQGLIRTGFLAWASGAGVRIGFADAREGAWVFYNHRIKGVAGETHAVDRNWGAAGLLGFSDEPMAFPLMIDAGARDEARALLREIGVEAGAALAAIVPGARWETKVWLPERFAETIDRLQADGGVRCVLVGGPEEAGLCKQIAELCQSRVGNLAGRTTLQQMAAVLERADVVLCHDSAPMHIATALGRPLVCLIGPTNPMRTGPYRRPEDVLRVPLACSPCYLRKLSKCAHEHRCMTELSVDRVWEAVRGRLPERCRMGAVMSPS